MQRSKPSQKTEEEQQDQEDLGLAYDEDSSDYDDEIDEYQLQNMPLSEQYKVKIGRYSDKLRNVCRKFKFSLSSRGIYKHLENCHGIRETWENDWYDQYDEPWESKWYIVTWPKKEGEQQIINLWFQSECEICQNLFADHKYYFHSLDNIRRQLIGDIKEFKQKQKKALEKEIEAQQRQEQNDQMIDQFQEEFDKIRHGQK